ncbi:hypothetical protein NDU88_007312 [Pleurodeles waltl]|uniref:Uncharacterized protein n=1 Tax=Pleurodeles waltl TaxID=8319 RepID=A0AAV7SSF5_PLEWA|nr:hypothetical protein NDU88_007312 [Pleurodeles waltl]
MFARSNSQFMIDTRVQCHHINSDQKVCGLPRIVYCFKISIELLQNSYDASVSAPSVRCHGDGHEASRRQGKPRTMPQGAHAFSGNDARSTVTRRPRSGREEKHSREWLGRAQHRNPETEERSQGGTLAVADSQSPS